MSDLFKSNYDKNSNYLWVPAATLACWALSPAILSGMKSGIIPCYIKKPKQGRFHRCEITVIRTQPESDALKRKWQKRRNEMEAKIAKKTGLKIDPMKCKSPEKR